MEYLVKGSILWSVTLSSTLEPVSMAQLQDDWTAILKHAYNTFQCEEDAYIEISKISIDNEIAMDYLYDNAVRDNDEVSSNLRKMYDEAINGTNKEVRRRVLSHMSHFKRLYG